jgi:hypothetical protein
MNNSENFENYPFWIVAVSNSPSILIYIFGIIIMAQLGWAAAILYVVYFIILEFRVLKNSCVNCYYWGKICAFGKGIISSQFFKKGLILHFCSNELTWQDLIPDLLIPAIPFLTGIILIFVDFKFITLIAMALIAFLSTKGNEYVRGKLACFYCRQRELGCPAFELFNKK